MPIGPFAEIPNTRPPQKVRLEHINELRRALTNIQDAYDVAVANGFVGTRANWLASLVGPKGAPGTVPIDSVATASDLTTIVDPAVDDVYTADDTGHAHRWTGSAWVDIGQWRGDRGPGGVDTELRARVDAAATNVMHPSFGAKGDGVTIDTDAIRAAITTAGIGGTLLFPPGKTFLIDAQLVPLSYQTWLGYGATIKRINQVATTTTTAITTGGTQTVGVASTAGFRVGMSVTVRGPEGHDTYNHPIYAIGSNTLTLGAGFAVAFAAGATLYSSVELVSHGGTPRHGFRCYGLTFDGNRGANTAGAYWQNQKEMYVSGDDTIIADCRFHDAQCEGIVGGGNGLIVRGNAFRDIGGNAIHLSASTGARIVGNTFDACNLGGGALGHQDGCISASNLVYDTVVAENTFDGGLSAAGGWDSDDNAGLIFRGNVVRNCTAYAVTVTPSNDARTVPEIIISDNLIYNAKRLNIQQPSGSASVGASPRMVLVTGNYLYNTRIDLMRTDDVDVLDNIVELPAVGAANTIAINIKGGRRNRIAGNRTSGGDYGIYIDDSPGLVVANNVVIGARLRGMSVYLAATIRGNTVVGTSAADAGYYGMVLGDGTTCQGNTVTAEVGAAGIRCPSGGAGVAAALVIDNVIRTPAGVPSIVILAGAQNNVVQRNAIVQAVSNGAGSGNTVADNTTILAA